MLSAGFDHETRDPGWAVDQEHELEVRLRHIVDELSARSVRVEIEGVECRQSQCRIAVHAVTSAALGSFYGVVESSDGLYGWAAAVILGEVVTRPDGEVDTLITAVFDRE